MCAAFLHEPAVGSMLPALLAPVSAAYAEGGAEAFGRALYGTGWTPADLPNDPDAVGRDLAMFRAFEPRQPDPACGPITITVGEHSPAIRHEAAQLLADAFGVPVRVLPGSGHAAHRDQPAAVAGLIRTALQTQLSMTLADRLAQSQTRLVQCAHRCHVVVRQCMVECDTA